MQNTIQKHYEKVKDLISYDEFQQQIKTQYQKYNALFSEETIALLILDEHGRNTTPLSQINQIKENNEYTVQGIITDIQETKEFKRKNGTPGKVANLTLTDTTGSCQLVLWNKDVKLIKQLNITTGTAIKIINGYTKTGYNGIEIHLGRWGSIERTKQPAYKTGIQQRHLPELTGTLSKRTHTNTFFKSDGSIGFVTNITLKVDQTEHIITLWDRHVKEIQQYTLGDRLCFNGIEEKQNNHKKELHLHRSGTIKKPGD